MPDPFSIGLGVAALAGGLFGGNDEPQAVGPAPLEPNETITQVNKSRREVIQKLELAISDLLDMEHLNREKMSDDVKKEIDNRVSELKKFQAELKAQVKYNKSKQKVNQSEIRKQQARIGEIETDLIDIQAHPITEQERFNAEKRLREFKEQIPSYKRLIEQDEKKIKTLEASIAKALGNIETQKKKISDKQQILQNPAYSESEKARLSDEIQQHQSMIQQLAQDIQAKNAEVGTIQNEKIPGLERTLQQYNQRINELRDVHPGHILNARAQKEKDLAHLQDLEQKAHQYMNQEAQSRDWHENEIKRIEPLIQSDLQYLQASEPRITEANKRIENLIHRDGRPIWDKAHVFNTIVNDYQDLINWDEFRHYPHERYHGSWMRGHAPRDAMDKLKQQIQRHVDTVNEAKKRLNDNTDYRTKAGQARDLAHQNYLNHQKTLENVQKVHLPAVNTDLQNLDAAFQVAQQQVQERNKAQDEIARIESLKNQEQTNLDAIQNQINSISDTSQGLMQKIGRNQELLKNITDAGDRNAIQQNIAEMQSELERINAQVPELEKQKLSIDNEINRFKKSLSSLEDARNIEGRDLEKTIRRAGGAEALLAQKKEAQQKIDFLSQELQDLELSGDPDMIERMDEIKDEIYQLKKPFMITPDLPKEFDQARDIMQNYVQQSQKNYQNLGQVYNQLLKKPRMEEHMQPFLDRISRDTLSDVDKFRDRANEEMVKEGILGDHIKKYGYDKHLLQGQFSKMGAQNSAARHFAERQHRALTEHLANKDIGKFNLENFQKSFQNVLADRQEKSNTLGSVAAVRGTQAADDINMMNMLRSITESHGSNTGELVRFLQSTGLPFYQQMQNAIQGKEQQRQQDIQNRHATLGVAGQTLGAVPAAMTSQAQFPLTAPPVGMTPISVAGPALANASMGQQFIPYNPPQAPNPIGGVFGMFAKGGQVKSSKSSYKLPSFNDVEPLPYTDQIERNAQYVMNARQDPRQDYYMNMVKAWTGMPGNEVMSRIGDAMYQTHANQRADFDNHIKNVRKATGFYEKLQEQRRIQHNFLAQQELENEKMIETKRHNMAHEGLMGDQNKYHWASLEETKASNLYKRLADAQSADLEERKLNALIENNKIRNQIGWEKVDYEKDRNAIKREELGVKKDYNERRLGQFDKTHELAVRTQDDLNAQRAVDNILNRDKFGEEQNKNVSEDKRGWAQINVNQDTNKIRQQEADQKNEIDKERLKIQQATLDAKMANDQLKRDMELAKAKEFKLDRASQNEFKEIEKRVNSISQLESTILKINELMDKVSTGGAITQLTESPYLLAATGHGSKDDIDQLKLQFDNLVVIATQIFGGSRVGVKLLENMKKIKAGLHINPEANRAYLAKIFEEIQEVKRRDQHSLSKINRGLQVWQNDEGQGNVAQPIEKSNVPTVSFSALQQGR